MNTDDSDYSFKIVLIGDPSVGKSNLLSYYTQNKFNQFSTTTVGVELASKKLKIDGDQIKASIWDTAGQEQFRAIADIFYKGAVGALLIYDITSQRSFLGVEKWLKEVQEKGDSQIITILVGNKIDLSDKREVATDAAAQFAEKNNMAFFETSAKDGTNVDKAFSSLINVIYKLIKNNKSGDNPYDDLKPKQSKLVNKQKKQDQKKSKCC